LNPGLVPRAVSPGLSMASCEKLLHRARTSPAGLRFEELCQLAECHGFIFARQNGSHRMYKRAGYPQVMNFQDDGGKAKGYQVKQLLIAIDDIASTSEEKDEAL